MSRGPDINQLPHLIRLLEDESLRPGILRELALLRPALESEIIRRKILLSQHDALLIRSLLGEEYAAWIKEAWQGLDEYDDEMERLEAAHSLLAQYQFGRLYPVSLRRRLDDLADEFDARYTQRNPLDLAEFLFQGYALKGVEQENYYHPFNSNLIHVIETKRGIPISLACIYMLVGHRLDMTIGGCNFPGHFLAVASTRNKQVIVDCFNGGMQIDQEGLSAIQAGVTEHDLLRLRCSIDVIIARVLRNLIHAYQQQNNIFEAEVMTGLLQQRDELPL